MSYALGILAVAIMSGPLCTYLVQGISVVTGGAYADPSKAAGLSMGSWLVQIVAMGVVSTIFLLPLMCLWSEVTEPRVRKLLPGLQALAAVCLVLFFLTVGLAIETYLVDKPEPNPEALIFIPRSVFGGIHHEMAEFLSVMLRVTVFGIGAYAAACIARRPTVPPMPGASGPALA
jgi:hypothetical protein